MPDSTQSSPYPSFPASEHHAPSHAQRLTRLDDADIVSLSLYVKPRAHAAASDLFAARAAAHAPDIAAITAFAAEHGLTVIEADARRRLVRLSGNAGAIRAAFGADLHWYQGAAGRFRAYTGMLHMHESIAPIVESVLGLDTRPVAASRLQYPVPGQAVAAYLPNEIGALYGIPRSPTGAGECIAIIELGGGFHQSDITSAFAAMGLAAPSVIAVSVDGAANAPSNPNGADGEVGLDIQVAGAIAPGAKIAVYFTPNTDAGFADAISFAAADTVNRPSVMSISWGGPESGYSVQARTTLNTALQDAVLAGVTVTVAAGDNLATDGVSDGAAHVDFPAASPFVVACGGTSITVTSGTITAEVVWNSGTSGTGGGISTVFPPPAYQSGVSLPPNVSTGQSGRGVPDVAADADPATGYQITVDGQTFAVGGTSAVAPLWAGFFALVNQGRGKRLGQANAALYANQAAFREITSGNNRPSGSTVGYQAGPGWNACTGLGVMRGAALLAALIKA